MIADVREDRLLVTSDVHVGNLFSDSRRGFVRLLEYARDRGFNVCINGDGIDTQYTSIRKLSTEAARLLADLGRLTQQITVYYTIGNHDLVLEQFLGDWGRFKLVPFLNVRSGDRRIRIEHGHLYDAVLMRHQDVRYDITWAFTQFFRLFPPAYHWHARMEKTKYRLRRRLRGSADEAERSPATRDVDPAYLEAARELGRRGFDTVIFGHTHYAGEVVMDDRGGRYLNTGSWFDTPHYVTIVDGVVRLEPWV